MVQRDGSSIFVQLPRSEISAIDGQPLPDPVGPGYPAPDFSGVDSGRADLAERFEHGLQSEGFYDCDDGFHGMDECSLGAPTRLCRGGEGASRSPLCFRINTYSARDTPSSMVVAMRRLRMQELLW